MIPAETTLIYSPYLIHHDARFNPRPDCFDPDRWLPDQQHMRGTFIPFGGGARKCIGDNYAMTLATLALSTIVAQWRFFECRPSTAACRTPDDPDPARGAGPGGMSSGNPRRQHSHRRRSGPPAELPVGPTCPTLRSWPVR
ncbi:cytochrome P450 [Streptomyces sp. L7]